MAIENARILAVDDNPPSLYATSHVLRSAGWVVLEATTGGDALKKAAQGVDLVVLDVNLPDIDGFEVCRRIRATESLARIPVVHLSATFVQDVDKVHGFEVGADGYLTHPVEPPVLIATVKAFLRTREAELAREQLLLSERAARAEAEKANRLKDEFLATLSHELRTPLHAIVGWAQLLKMGSLSPQEVAEGIDAIERNAQAQAQMIADLLDVSRITSGKMRLDVRQVDLSSTVEAALSAISPAAEAKGIEMLRRLDMTVGPITGDPARLQQVVWNLVNNAVKFTPKGGKITVSLKKLESHVELCVSDTGKGIGPEFLPDIFDRFRQGDATSTREHGGLGLGLALARQFTEMHGGTIRAESAGEGKGTTFTITLPLDSTQLAPLPNGGMPRVHSSPNAPATQKFVQLKGVRILVVDDEADARKLLDRILSETGAQIRVVEGVDEALEMLEDFKPHVLVSDIGMPRNDGFDLIRKVRERGDSFQDLPAVALTAFARPEDRDRALLAGFQMHVAKPVNPPELAAVIGTLVGRG